MSEKRFKINTLEIGYIYLDNPDGKHMSWIEVEDTLNSLYNENKQLKKQLEKAKEYFMDYLLKEMSANNFSELWDLVIGDE